MKRLFFLFRIIICVPVLFWVVDVHVEVGTAITGQKNTLNLLAHEEIVIDVGHQKLVSMISIRQNVVFVFFFFHLTWHRNYVKGCCRLCHYNTISLLSIQTKFRKNAMRSYYYIFSGLISI